MGLFNGKAFSGINKAFTKAFNFNTNAIKVGVAAVAPGAGQYMATQETNALNEKMTREANAINLANWNRQTQYNSPAEQMKRLESAGLNPNLAYGQIAESKMSSAPSVEAPRYEAPDLRGGLLSGLSAYQQVVNMHELNKKMRLDNDYTAYENNVLKGRGQLKGDSGAIKEILGAWDILRGLGRHIADRPSSDFVRLKKDNR